MPSRQEARLRHARHYARLCAETEQLYRDGQQAEGLDRFDQERAQIDAGRTWALEHAPSCETDSLLLAYGDATASIGELRYRLREERIPQLEVELQAARRLGRQRAEGNALGNLALAFAYLGDYERATAMYLQRVNLARSIGDRRGEGAALGNLGNAYKDQGNYRQALVCHEQALAIWRELQDSRGEGAELGNLGNVYYSLGVYTEAIAHHERHLEIARRIGDRRA